jgi:DnaA family protein
MTNQQLALDIAPGAPPSLENFVIGRNGEALAALAAIAAGTARERAVHLWGEHGCGKTHLLTFLGGLPGARYLDLAAPELPLAHDPGVPVWAIDNVERADPTVQIALFTLINEVRSSRAAAVITASAGAPRFLALREDLRTRLGWGLVCQLHALDDGESEAALRRHVAERGLLLSAEVGHFLLTRFSRNMASLIAVIDALDRYALERQRPLTLPLVREWLQAQESSVHVP